MDTKIVFGTNAKPHQDFGHMSMDDRVKAETSDILGATMFVAGERIEDGEMQYLVQWLEGGEVTESDWIIEEILVTEFPEQLKVWRSQTRDANRKTVVPTLTQDDTEVLDSYEQNGDTRLPHPPAYTTQAHASAATVGSVALSPLTGGKKVAGGAVDWRKSLAHRDQLFVRCINKMADVNDDIMAETKDMLRQRRQFMHLLNICGDGNGGKQDATLKLPDRVHFAIDSQWDKDDSLERMLAKLKAALEDAQNTGDEVEDDRSDTGAETHEMQLIKNMRSDLADLKDNISRLQRLEEQLQLQQEEND